MKLFDILQTITVACATLSAIGMLAASIINDADLAVILTQLALCAIASILLKKTIKELKQEEY